MAKKINGYVRLQVKAGEANPSPPVGPALGQQGVNIMEFCKAFNAATAKMEKGLPIPVVITVYSDRSFTFITKTPPASVLLKKSLKLASGSGKPNTEKVGKATRAQLEEIAKMKQPDLTAASLDAAVRTIATGRSVRVAVLAQGANADAGKKAGADIVGFEDLAETILKGEINFDVLIATPDAMRVVGKLGQVLGPKGLMPNPKVGTVTADVATAVNNAKRGQVQFRSDKNGIVHVSIGKADFEAKKLAENFKALLADLRKAKPASAKGTYIKKVVLSSTMGPAVTVDRASLAEAK